MFVVEKYKDIVERWSKDYRTPYVKATSAFDTAYYTIDKITTGNLSHNIPSIKLSLEKLLAAFIEESELHRAAKREIRKLKKEIETLSENEHR